MFARADVIVPKFAVAALLQLPRPVFGVPNTTVKWHVNVILRRFGVNNRTHAGVVAAQRGIVEI
ncbi:MAG: hypothetical protein ABJF23_12135 [Bryobacteraceae bacterium]